MQDEQKFDTPKVKPRETASLLTLPTHPPTYKPTHPLRQPTHPLESASLTMTSLCVHFLCVFVCFVRENPDDKQKKKDKKKETRIEPGQVRRPIEARDWSPCSAPASPSFSLAVQQQQQQQQQQQKQQQSRHIQADFSIGYQPLQEWFPNFRGSRPHQITPPHHALKEELIEPKSAQKRNVHRVGSRPTSWGTPSGSRPSPRVFRLFVLLYCFLFPGFKLLQTTTQRTDTKGGGRCRRRRGADADADADA